MQHKLLILSPFEVPDTKLALATIQAGVFPILHLGRDKKKAQKELQILSSKTDQAFGVCIVSDNMRVLTLPENVTKVLVPFGIKNSFKEEVEVLYQVHCYKEM